jgi:serine/threonine-protein kinase
MFVKLLDFGIAKDVSARITTLTLTGEVVGSALYVSPEQLHEANSVGPSTDIWSLGIVLYEVLTGRLPFEGRSLPELFMRVVEGHYTPVSEVGRGLPKALDGFFEQVIQQDPKRRFQSVDELGAAFGRIVRANSSGLLLKQDTPRTLPVAELIAPGVNPMSKPENAMLVDRTTDRLAKPWPRALAAAVFVACVVAAVFAFRMRRDGSQPPVTSRPPVASASDAPAQSGPAREAAPPTAAVASQPPPAANALPPAVAADLPAGKSGFPETARTPKPKAAATPASTPRPNSTNAPLKPMPHNHGF